MSYLHRLRLLFAPGRGAKIVVGMGGFLAATIVACLAVLLLTAPPERSGVGMTSLELFTFILSAAVLPGLALFLALAALLEKRDPPRAFLWGSATLLLTCAGLLMTLIMLFDERRDRLVFATITLTTVVGPVVLLFSLPAVYFIARSIPELRVALWNDRSQRACELIRGRGEMMFAQLAQELDIPLGEVDELLDELLRSGKLQAVLYVPWQRVYMVAVLAEKQRFLLELIRSQGRVYLPDLPALLKAPKELVHDWLYQLVQRGQFNGYINWKQGWLYSLAAQKIGADSQCPQCGGALSAGRALTIRCLHCGSEMLFGNRN